MSEIRNHSIKQRVFEVTWRLAILSLPWQARWFSDASLAGWPWEQGRWSVYGSMILIGIAVVCAPKRFEIWENAESRTKVRRLALAVLVLGSILSLFGDSRALRPVMQWWLQVTILGLFVRALWRARVSAVSLARWFVLSLLPCVLLGFWQSATQMVVASKWFGIAQHLPQTLGTSVVEVAGARLLRIYGPFPHPNIFGAWLALGLILCVWLVVRSRRSIEAMGWIATAASLSVALVLTFARSAWLGAGCALAVGFFLIWSKTSERMSRHFLLGIFAIMACAALTTVSIERRFVFARLDPGLRLEAKSINVRAQSLADGWRVFWAHPMFGVGPNAELLSLAGSGQAKAPLEPPHAVFLLILADVGLLGALAFFVLLGSWGSIMQTKMIPFLLAVALPGLFDHFLWSNWSGQGIVAIFALFSLLLSVPVYSKIDNIGKDT